VWDAATRGLQVYEGSCVGEIQWKSLSRNRKGLCNLLLHFW